LISLALFVIRQRKLETPMLDMRVFAYPMFSLAIVVMMIVVMTMFATMIVMPIYLLKVLSFSAVTVGLVMLPGGLINGAISPVMGYLFDKFGPRWLLIPGIVTMTLTVFLFRSLDQETTPMTIVVLHTLMMVSVAMVMMPAQTNGLNQLPPSLYPHGAAIANTLMQVSGAIGTALFVTIMTMGRERYTAGIAHPGTADETAALAAGVKQAFTFGFLLAIIALILALFVKRVVTTPTEQEEKREKTGSLQEEPEMI
jgi:MFS transporter, DHA2 family, lincomycin resistance protein